MESMVFITIFKGIQETTNLDYGFASGLSKCTGFGIRPLGFNYT